MKYGFKGKKMGKEKGRRKEIRLRFLDEIKNVEEESNAVSSHAPFIK